MKISEPPLFETTPYFTNPSLFMGKIWIPLFMKILKTNHLLPVPLLPFIKGWGGGGGGFQLLTKCHTKFSIVRISIFFLDQRTKIDCYFIFFEKVTEFIPFNSMFHFLLPKNFCFYLPCAN